MSFRGCLCSGRRLLGTLLTLPSIEVAEILAATPLDWLFIDLEHSAMDMLHAQRFIQVSSKPCLVRVPSASPLAVQKALDSGAAGVILPQIRTLRQLDEIIDAAKFPPQGKRSVGLSRASGYGRNLESYLRAANAETSIVAQIEHSDAMESLAELAASPHVDALFVGPYDLSASLGVPGEISGATVQGAIDRVLAECRAAGKAAGIYCGSAAVAKEMLRRGFSFVAIGSDSLFLSGAVEAAVQEIV